MSLLLWGNYGKMRSMDRHEIHELIKNEIRSHELAGSYSVWNTGFDSSSRHLARYMDAEVGGRLLFACSFGVAHRQFPGS
jgi:hypothetical protein